MSRQYDRWIPRVGDKALLNAFLEVALAFDIPGITVHTVTGLHLNVQVEGFPGEQIKPIFEADGQVISAIALTIGQYATLAVNRNREQASPFWEHMHLDRGQKFHEWPAEEQIKTNVVLAKAFSFAGAADPTLKRDPEAFTALFNQYESSLAHLRAMLADQTGKAIEERRNLDARLISERDRLQGEFDTKERELTDRLKVREAALEKRIKGADESDAKTARRAIRQAMLQDAQDRARDFGLSKRTGAKRVQVQIGFLVLLSALAWMGMTGWSDSRSVWLALSNVTQGQILTIHWSELGIAWIRLSFASIGFVATLLYYIRWEMRWADMHAASEMQLQQFHVDVNRANWVIESALEWKKETGEVVPNDLLNQLSKNLFMSKADEDASKVLHPADELASALMGSASKLRLNIAGNELEFDRPGRIAKETKASV